MLVDYIVAAFNTTDFNAEMSFEAVKRITIFRAFFEELGRKFIPWTDEAVKRAWAEVHSEHDDVSRWG